MSKALARELIDARLRELAAAIKAGRRTTTRTVARDADTVITWSEDNG